MTEIAGFRGLLMTYGVITVGLGLVLAAWPRETVAVVAVLIGLQLLLYGVMRIVLAIRATGTDGSARVLLGVTGAAGVGIGLLCLFEPVQSVVVLSVLVGAWWAVSGLLSIVAALRSSSAHRAWDAAGGVVGVLVGAFLVVNPDTSLRIFVAAVCVWLVLTGVAAIVGAWVMRPRSSAAGPRGGTAPGTVLDGP
jgi:uncharacterized membrane protein HdeD (DUF308 family)